VGTNNYPRNKESRGEAKGIKKEQIKNGESAINKVQNQARNSRKWESKSSTAVIAAGENVSPAGLGAKM